MSREIRGFMVSGAVLLFTAALAPAQQQTTTTETKSFEVIAVQGNDLVVKLPEGTKEIDVPEDFRFTVDGQQLSVHDLKPGMKGTARITTKTTLHPVTVTEVKNGTVRQVSGSSMIVQTDQGFKSFTQSDVEKRGVKIVKDGKPAELSDFHTGDILTATIVTSRPPRAVTEKQVNAALASGGGAASAGRPSGGGAASAGRPSGGGAASAGSSTAATSGTPAASRQTAGGAGASPSSTGRKLPKTASPLPLVSMIGVTSLLIAIALMIRRRGSIG